MIYDSWLRRSRWRISKRWTSRYEKEITFISIQRMNALFNNIDYNNIIVERSRKTNSQRLRARVKLTLQSECMSNNQRNVSTKQKKYNEYVQLIISQQCKKVAKSRKADNNRIIYGTKWIFMTQEKYNFSSKEEKCK